MSKYMSWKTCFLLILVQMKKQSSESLLSMKKQMIVMFSVWVQSNDLVMKSDCLCAINTVTNTRSSKTE